MRVALKLRRILSSYIITFGLQVQIIGVVAKIDLTLRALYESLKSHLLLPKFIISMPAKLIVRFSYLMLATVKAAIATQNAFE